MTMKLALTAGSQPSQAWLDEAVRAQHAHRPFLTADDIAEAMRLISTIQLWNEVAIRLGAKAPEVKAQLKAIVDRRNKIAHEADLDPTQPGRRWPITDGLAMGAVEYIDDVVRAIDACV